MNKMCKSNKGITLIALVITIIILLILAGITIFTLTGGNGLFSRAKEAKEKSEIAAIKEEISIKVNNFIADYASEQGKNPTAIDYFEYNKSRKDEDIEEFYLLYNKTASIKDQYSTTINMH